MYFAFHDVNIFNLAYIVLLSVELGVVVTGEVDEARRGYTMAAA